MSEPLFRVVRGAPTDEDIAALTVALLALLTDGTCASGPAGERARWTDAAQYRNPVSWQHVRHAA